MTQFRKAQEAGHETLRRRFDMRRSGWTFWLPTGVVVGGVNLFHAWQNRSLVEAIVAVVIWLIFFPVWAHWLKTRRGQEPSIKP